MVSLNLNKPVVASGETALDAKVKLTYGLKIC